MFIDKIINLGLFENQAEGFLNLFLMLLYGSDWISLYHSVWHIAIQSHNISQLSP